MYTPFASELALKITSYLPYDFSSFIRVVISLPSISYTLTETKPSLGIWNFMVVLGLNGLG